MVAVRRMVAFWVLLLWGAATVHCGLELDGLFGAPSHSSNVAGTSGDNDLDGCGAIENGYFDGSVAGITLGLPTLMAGFALTDCVVRVESRTETVTFERSQAPPELVPLWIFERRTALPARAPDFVA